jgi:hypothetical protein
MEGRRYRGRDIDREDKKGDVRQEIQGEWLIYRNDKKEVKGRRYSGRDCDREDKKGRGRQKIQCKRQR